MSRIEMHIQLGKDGGLCRSSGTAPNSNFGWKRRVVASSVPRLHIKLEYIYTQYNYNGNGL
jgi:hypothetical protein